MNYFQNLSVVDSTHPSLLHYLLVTLVVSRGLDHRKIGILIVMLFFNVAVSLNISGADAAKYLHSQLSADILELGVGETSPTLLLEPNGHLVSLAEIHRISKDEFVLIVPAAALEAVLVRLRMFLIRTKATIEVDSWLNLVVDTDDSFSESAIATSGSLPGYYQKARPYRDEESVLDGAIDPSYIGLCAISNWPVSIRDIALGALPNSIGELGRYASFTKGCYTGQELVERVDSRGAKAPSLVMAFAGTGFSDELGAEVFQNSKGVGFVTSIAAVSHDLLELAKLNPKIVLDDLSSYETVGFMRVTRAFVTDNLTFLGETAKEVKVAAIF